jgi:hypothetical protein
MDDSSLCIRFFVVGLKLPTFFLGLPVVIELLQHRGTNMMLKYCSHSILHFGLHAALSTACTVCGCTEITTPCIRGSKQESSPDKATSRVYTDRLR